MATNFSPCKGSYVLNQFPSNVMFGMNGFHLSASGAIQGHDGPLVLCSIHTLIMLTHYQKTEFRLVGIESICILQNKCNPETEISFEKAFESILKKRRKCWLPPFSLFYPQLIGREDIVLALSVRSNFYLALPRA